MISPGKRQGYEMMKKYTLQARIKKTYIGVFTVILLLTTVAMYLINGRVYQDKSWQLCEQLVNLNLEALNSQVMELQNRQEMIAKNETVKNMVCYYDTYSRRDYDAELQYRRALDDIFYLFTYSDKVSAAYILDKNGNYIYFYRESPKVGYNMMEEEWYRSLTDGICMDTCYVSGIHSRDYLVNETKEPCISIVRPIQAKSRYTFSADAYLVCDIALRTVLGQTDSDDSMQFAILDKDNEMYAGEGQKISEDKADAKGRLQISQEDAKERQEISKNKVASEEKTELLGSSALLEEIKDQDVFVRVLHQGLRSSSIVVSMKSKMFGWKVIGIKNLDEIADLRAYLLLILVITIAVMTALVAYLSRKVAGSLLKPMDLLITECNQVAGGDYDVKFRDKPSQEISFLSDTIQDMVTNVVELSEKVVEEERKLSEEKLRVLQHQINPHFLNNVLQTIKALAVAGENEKVSRISTLLGHILAYSVYEPYENVELRTELEYLEDYIELQNIRYDNRIFCSIECEQELCHIQIPKLTLQPLVENAIEHGLKNRKKLILNISTDIEKEDVCVIINDNGNGISEEELEELRDRIAKGETYQEKNSIGIVNVNERLQKMFGKQYGVQIHSRYQSGTTVVVTIPGGEDI